MLGFYLGDWGNLLTGHSGVRRFLGSVCVRGRGPHAAHLTLPSGGGVGGGAAAGGGNGGGGGGGGGGGDEVEWSGVEWSVWCAPLVSSAGFVRARRTPAPCHFPHHHPRLMGGGGRGRAREEEGAYLRAWCVR